MQKPPTLVIAWLVATLVVDAIVWVWAMTGFMGGFWIAVSWPPMFPAFVLLFALVPTQVSLLAIWATVSARPWPARFAAVACGIALWTLPCDDTGFGWAGYACLYIVPTLLIVLELAIARLAGFQVAHVASVKTGPLGTFQ